MNTELETSKSILIKTHAENVWKIVTLPEKIRLWLFGTEVATSWKVGTPISFTGNYNNITYHDKGNVLQNIPNQLLKYNYWSSFSGLEDKEENYSLVTYKIEEVKENEVQFIWHQKGFANEEGKCHTKEGLGHMLQQIKKLSEEL